MKKILSFLTLFIVFFIPINVYAYDASVNIEVVGKVEKGATIEILVNLKEVENFYAASVDFTYDNSQLKVESIVASEFITKYSNDIMELGGETDKNGNTASYSFTFLGDNKGISGSGALVKITANVLNNEKLSINQDNMKVKLVHRVGDTVENYSYSFSGYSVDDTTNVSNDSISSDNNNMDNVNNNSSDKENVSGNKNENSTINTGESDSSLSNNNDVNSNKSNNSSSNIQEQNSNSDSNKDKDEIIKDNSEKEENQITNTKSGSEVINDNGDESKTESSNKRRNVIWVVAVIGIFVIIGVGIKYRSKL